MGMTARNRPEFWIVVMPPGTGGTSRRTAAPAAPLQKITPATLSPGAPTPDAEEGFPNSHDSLECAKCHEKDPGNLQKGLSVSFPYGSGGANSFCRRCHEGSDKSHFPRDNHPRETVTCLSCHQAHGNSPLFPALRQAYPLFLMRSADINPHGAPISIPTAARSSAYPATRTPPRPARPSPSATKAAQTASAGAATRK
jgi:hypothetical protein